MANFLQKVPSTLRLCSVSASSNGPSLSVPQSKGPVILELPLDKIRRPLMATRANDPHKVQELMDSVSKIGLQVPNLVSNNTTWKQVFTHSGGGLEIDVLEVDGVYYGFSGCHRYEAHQRLGLPTIRCKVRRGTKETLRHHLR